MSLTAPCVTRLLRGGLRSGLSQAAAARQSCTQRKHTHLPFHRADFLRCAAASLCKHCFYFSLQSVPWKDVLRPVQRPQLLDAAFAQPSTSLVTSLSLHCAVCFLPPSLSRPPLPSQSCCCCILSPATAAG